VLAVRQPIPYLQSHTKRGLVITPVQVLEVAPHAVLEVDRHQGASLVPERLSHREASCGRP
jgi:hypothetical protein